MGKETGEERLSFLPLSRRYRQSLQYLEWGRKLIPLATQTFSKGAAYFPEGAYPVYLRKGKGSHVWDVDAHEYIDYICGLGAISLGYNHPAVNRAIAKQLRDGIVFSLPHPLEVEVAELLTDIIPCAEMVRFCKNATDATTAAVKIAREYTGKERIAYCGYHGGSSDWYGIATDRPYGIPRVLKNYIFPFEYNNLSSLEALFAQYDIAGVIMEPMTFTLPEPGFLFGVRELAHHYNAIFILDETLTGFRISLAGGQEYFGVVPDLAIFGKAMGNGMPIAALVGQRDLMKQCEKIFFSYTLGGECLSLAAAKATILTMIKDKTIEHIRGIGTELMATVSEIGFRTIGLPCRFHLTWQEEDNLSRSLLIQELARRGILTHSLGINFCAAHSRSDLFPTVRAYLEVWDIVQQAMREGKINQLLEGKPIQPAFRRA